MRLTLDDLNDLVFDILNGKVPGRSGGEWPSDFDPGLTWAFCHAAGTWRL